MCHCSCRLVSTLTEQFSPDTMHHLSPSSPLFLFWSCFTHVCYVLISLLTRFSAVKMPLVPYESGEYVITDALNATEPRNGRWQPVVIYGEQPANGATVTATDAAAAMVGSPPPSAPRLRRPTFVLPPRDCRFY